MIRVLIVDDSAVIRNLLKTLLSAEPDIEVVGIAADPYIAREKLIKLKPDVMTLDIEMPKMDGISFLEKVMEHLPVRTLIISSLSRKGSELALKAYEAGAADILEKPATDLTTTLEQFRKELLNRVRAVAQTQLKALKHSISARIEQAPHFDENQLSSLNLSHYLVGVASSTGGIAALKKFFSTLPKVIPPMLIVQHMPTGFAKGLVERLNQTYPFEFKLAVEGDLALPGRILIAPEDFHLEIVENKGKYLVQLNQNPPLHNVRPAADYLFKSLAKSAHRNGIGVVFTGMGQDGAQGLLEIKQQGGYTLAQNEESSAVFGMAKTAIQLGAIHEVLPIEKIGPEIIEYCVRKLAS